ncbi:hypothetical protein Scep_010536 [Stephania cephalantha]|uniref:Uncharacterized protein n=1 Tax=Stephania cephalantha TaxID=152367 RepID=A0AAP0JW90_9MAGN
MLESKACTTQVHLVIGDCGDDHVVSTIAAQDEIIQITESTKRLIGLLCLARPEVKQIVVSRTTRRQTGLLWLAQPEVNRLNKPEANYVGQRNVACNEAEQRNVARCNDGTDIINCKRMMMNTPMYVYWCWAEAIKEKQPRE